MNRASFRTKSMSLNVSGKHIIMQKYVYTFFSLLSHASHVARVNNHILKKKVQRKVHFVESMVCLYAYKSVFQLSVQLSCYCNTIYTCFRMQKKKIEARNSKISKPAAVTNQILYHHFSLVVACFFISFLTRLALVHWVLIWFGLVLVALFMCLNAVCS